MGINRKSGILSWSEDNINSAPSVLGIFILRTSPSTDSIEIIEAVENIKESLSNKMKESLLPGVKFFDWYEFENIEEAKKLVEAWSEKYIS